MLNLLGQFGPLVGTRLYPDDDKPYYVKGMAVCGGFMFFVGVLAVILRTILASENKRLGVADSEEQKKQEEEGLVEKEVAGEKTRFMNIL